MARRGDTSVETFLKENPEYNINRLLEKIPKMESVPLREGAPSSLAAVRRRVSEEDRVDQAMRLTQDAYRKWRDRRMGALRYRSAPSVSDHLGDVQRRYTLPPSDPRSDMLSRIANSETGITESMAEYIRDRFATDYQKALRRLHLENLAALESDTGLSYMEEFEDTGGFEDTDGFEDTGSYYEPDGEYGVPPDWLTEMSDAVLNLSIDDMIDYNQERSKYGLEPLHYRYDEATDTLIPIPGAEEAAKRAKDVREGGKGYTPSTDTF